MADSIASAKSRPDEERAADPKKDPQKDPDEASGRAGGSAGGPDGPGGTAGAGGVPGEPAGRRDRAGTAGVTGGASGEGGSAGEGGGPAETAEPTGTVAAGGASGGPVGAVGTGGAPGRQAGKAGKADKGGEIDKADTAGTAGASRGPAGTAEAAGTASAARPGNAGVAGTADALPYGPPGRPFAKSPFMFGLTGALGVLTAWGLAQALVSARSVIVLTLVALFLAAGLNPIVEALQRRRVPRRAAISIVFVAVIAFFVLFGLAIVPPVTSETTNFIQAIPGYVNELLGNETIKQLDAEFQLLARLRDYVVSGDLGATVAGGILGAGAVVLDGIFSGFTLLVLTLYFLGSLPTIKEYLLSLVPASRRARTRAMSDEILDGIGGYVAGNVLISAIAGVVAWLFLVIAGAEYALALALVVAVTDLIPLVGATIGAVIVTGVTLLQSVPLGIASAIFFLIYQQVENYLIYPKVMKRSVDVAPAVTIIAALFGGALLGIVGALIAIPAAAAVALIIREVVIPRQAAL